MDIRRWVAALVAVLGAVTATVTLVDEDGPGPAPPRVAVEIRLPGGEVVTADRDNELEAGESREAATETAPGGAVAEAPGVHEDLRDEQPAGAPPDAAEKVVERAPEPPLEPVAPAGAQAHSCPRSLVRNFSARVAGAKVTMFVLHYTVSRPGSLDAIWRLFNTPSFGASSHLLLEPFGRCRQIVPWAKKAWTQGAFNSVSESVEIMAMGTESREWWLSQPIIRDGILASIMFDRLRARGLPLRRVDPVGCSPEAGWTDHDALECGNNHHDVQPAFPYDVLQAQLALRGGLVRTCRRVHAYRERRRAGLVGTTDGRLRQKGRLWRVEQAGLRCVAGRPVSR